MTYEQYIRWAESKAKADPEEPITQTELDSFFEKVNRKITGESTEQVRSRRGNFRKAYNRSFYGDERREAERIYNLLEGADTRDDINAIDIPSVTAVGPTRREKLVRFKVERAREEFFEERTEARREEAVEFIRTRDIEFLQRQTKASLRARELTEEEIRLIKEGVKPSV